MWGQEVAHAPDQGTESPGDEAAHSAWTGRVAALYVLGFVLWVVSLPYIKLSHINGLGFAGAFGPLTWAGLLLVSVGLVVNLTRTRTSTPWFWWLTNSGLVLLLLIIHGTPAIVESAPSFFEAYQHVGFIGYIYRTHQHSSTINYRLSWFGAFGMAATLAGTAGPPALLGAIRLNPLIFDSAVLIPVYSIVRRFVPDARRRGWALAIFVVGNWIGQDYFSPQAMAYFMSMSIIALLLHLAPASGPSVRHWREWLRPKRTDAAVVVVATLMAIGVVLAHQISPLMLLGLTLVLSLTGYVVTRWFPIVLFSAVLTWLSAGAGNFWFGNFDRLLGVNQQGGQKVGISSIIAENLTNRLEQFGLAEVVALGRVALTGVLLFLAFHYAWKQRRDVETRVVGFLAVVPFVFLLTTGYGGEALMRAYFFSLPFLSVLIAKRLVTRKFSPRRVAVWCLSLALLATGTEVARYGNEQFEQITADQLASMTWLYHAVPDGVKMLAFGSAEPLNFIRFGDYTTYQMDFFKVNTIGPSATLDSEVNSIIQQTVADQPQLVIWTPEAVIFDVHTRHYKRGWGRRVLRYIENEPYATFVINRPDIKIIDLDPSLHLTPPKDLRHG